MAAQLYYNTSYPATHLLIPYHPPVCMDAPTESAYTLTRRHKPLSSVHCGAKLSLQTAPSDPRTRTHTHPYQSTPCGFQPLGEFGETLPKYACWAGDYNAVLPAESQEPAKSCLGLHPPPHFSLLFPYVLSFSLWGVCLSLNRSIPLFITSLPVPPSLIFLTLDLWALFVSLLPSLLCSALQRGERSRERRNTGRKTEVEWRETTQIRGRLIRNPHWQGSVGWVG